MVRRNGLKGEVRFIAARGRPMLSSLRGQGTMRVARLLARAAFLLELLLYTGDIKCTPFSRLSLRRSACWVRMLHCVKNTTYQDRLTRAHSACLFDARPKGESVGSDAWALRPVQRTRRQTITTTVGLGVCVNLCTHNNTIFFALGTLFRLANFTAENAIGSKSELKI